MKKKTPQKRSSPTKIDLKAMKKSRKRYQKVHAQYKRHTAKRGNKPNAVVLTSKAVDEILLCLQMARRNADDDRRYLKWIMDVLQMQLQPPAKGSPKKRRTKK